MIVLRFFPIFAAGLLATFSLSATPRVDEPYGNLKLLTGYKFKRERSFDSIGGRIHNDTGFYIQFESGTGAGYAADPKRRTEYTLFREQIVSGHNVFIAITKRGAGTNWEPESRRPGKKGRLVLVTFPGSMSPLDAANFYAEVFSEEELADMLLMVMTFNRAK